MPQHISSVHVFNSSSCPVAPLQVASCATPSSAMSQAAACSADAAEHTVEHTEHSGPGPEGLSARPGPAGLSAGLQVRASSAQAGCALCLPFVKWFLGRRPSRSRRAFRPAALRRPRQAFRLRARERGGICFSGPPARPSARPPSGWCAFPGERSAGAIKIACSRPPEFACRSSRPASSSSSGRSTRRGCGGPSTDGSAA